MSNTSATRHSTAAPQFSVAGFMKTIAARLALTCIGLALPLVVLEVVLRAFGPILPGQYSAALYQEPHPTYGRLNVPNSG